MKEFDHEKVGKAVHELLLDGRTEQGLNELEQIAVMRIVSECSIKINQ